MFGDGQDRKRGNTCGQFDIARYTETKEAHINFQKGVRWVEKTQIEFRKWYKGKVGCDDEAADDEWTQRRSENPELKAKCISTGKDTLLVAERYIDNNHCDTNRNIFSHSTKGIRQLKPDRLEHFEALVQNRMNMDGLTKGDEQLAALVAKDADMQAYCKDVEIELEPPPKPPKGKVRGRPMDVAEEFEHLFEGAEAGSDGKKPKVFDAAMKIGEAILNHKTALKDINEQAAKIFAKASEGEAEINALCQGVESDIHTTDLYEHLLKTLRVRGFAMQISRGAKLAAWSSSTSVQSTSCESFSATAQESQESLTQLAEALSKANMPAPINMLDRLKTLPAIRHYLATLQSGTKIDDEQSVEAVKSTVNVYIERFKTLVDSCGRAVTQLTSAKATQEAKHRADVKKEAALMERLHKQEDKRKQRQAFKDAKAEAKAEVAENAKAEKAAAEAAVEVVLASNRRLLDMQIPSEGRFKLHTITWADMQEAECTIDVDMPYLVVDIDQLNEVFKDDREVRVALQMFMAGFGSSAQAKKRGRAHGEINMLPKSRAIFDQLFPGAPESLLTELGQAKFTNALKTIHGFGYSSNMRWFSYGSNGLAALRITTNGEAPRRCSVHVQHLRGGALGRPREARLDPFAHLRGDRKVHG